MLYDKEGDKNDYIVLGSDIFSLCSNTRLVFVLQIVIEINIYRRTKKTRLYPYQSLLLHSYTPSNKSDALHFILIQGAQCAHRNVKSISYSKYRHKKNPNNRHMLYCLYRGLNSNIFHIYLCQNMNPN